MIAGRTCILEFVKKLDLHRWCSRLIITIKKLHDFYNLNLGFDRINSRSSMSLVTSLLLSCPLLIFAFIPNSFAREGCNRHCLEKILSQITTLREEVKNAIPIGTILPYSGSQAIPEGYLLCNGKLVGRQQYPILFSVIGLTYTAQNEHSGTRFNLPDLNGKTLIGTSPGHRRLGETLGAETQQLYTWHLPPHHHSGTTKDENRDHFHTGITGDDHPDHTHRYSRHHMGLVPLYSGIHLNHAGSNHNIAENNWGDYGTNGASTRHRHNFTTAIQNQKHQHDFTTDNGADLHSVPFSIMQPSIVVRYIIKAK